MYCAEIGAKIINCSWGSSSYSRASEEVVNEVVSKGILLCVSAGNDNCDNDLLPAYPANYPGVLCVGASDNSNEQSTFSNYGYCTQLLHPAQIYTLQHQIIHLLESQELQWRHPY